jgi:ferredoxin
MNIQIVKKGDIEIHIHRAMCIGVATCVVYAPSTFDIDDENIAIVKQGEWDRLEKIVAAARVGGDIETF